MVKKVIKNQMVTDIKGEGEKSSMSPKNHSDISSRGVE